MVWSLRTGLRDLMWLLIKHQIAWRNSSRHMHEKQRGGLMGGVLVRREICWKPPVEDYVKVNWDAALNEKENRGGIGVVIRDNHGEVLVSLCGPKKNISNPLVAEMHAL